MSGKRRVIAHVHHSDADEGGHETRTTVSTRLSLGSGEACAGHSGNFINMNDN